MPERKTVSARYPKAEVVLATDNSLMIVAFRDQYGDPISNLDPESVHDTKEPLTGAIQAALYKIREVASTVSPEVGQQAIIIGADVEFRRKNKPNHRPARNGELTKKAKNKLVEKAVRWYEEPFAARWKVSFATERVENIMGSIVKEKRVVQLDIKADFPEGIPKKIIKERFNVNSNALIELVEAGRGRATFTIGQMLDEREIPLAQDQAESIIRNKILPAELIRQLLDNEKSSVYTDQFGIEWGMVNFGLIELFGNSENV